MLLFSSILLLIPCLFIVYICIFRACMLCFNLNLLVWKCITIHFFLAIKLSDMLACLENVSWHIILTVKPLDVLACLENVSWHIILTLKLLDVLACLVNVSWHIILTVNPSDILACITTHEYVGKCWNQRFCLTWCLHEFLTCVNRWFWRNFLLRSYLFLCLLYLCKVS